MKVWGIWSFNGNCSCTGIGAFKDSFLEIKISWWGCGVHKHGNFFNRNQFVGTVNFEIIIDDYRRMGLKIFCTEILMLNDVEEFFDGYELFLVLDILYKDQSPLKLLGSF